MEALIHFITGLGVAAIALVIFAESGLLIGFFLPGDSLLFTAGFLVQQGTLSVNIFVLMAILFVAAVLGDSVGYTFGRRVGKRLFTRSDSLLFHQDNVRRAEEFYLKHGGKAIILARFVPIVRTFAPIVAGIGHMPYRSFLAYNLVGGALWAAGLTYLGYVAGRWFEARGINIDDYLLPIVAFIVITSVLPPLIHILKDEKSRRQLKEVFGRQWRRWKS